jgi:acetyltransferase-like isoleucine patch superfamily enzyme
MPFSTTLLADVKNARIMIGDNCRVNGAYIHAQKEITIGKNCVIASGVHIIDSNGHELYSNNRTRGRDVAKEIVIGDNVWIGLNAIILKDTRIGNNSVVAAGSVVKGNFPENSLIQGNPAVLVKRLEINEDDKNTFSR